MMMPVARLALLRAYPRSEPLPVPDGHHAGIGGAGFWARYSAGYL